MLESQNVNGFFQSFDRIVFNRMNVLFDISLSSLRVFLRLSAITSMAPSEMSSLLLVAIQFGTWFLAVAYAYAINTLHRVKRIHTRDEPMKWATRMNWRAAPKLYWLYHSNFPHECLLTGIELTGAEAKRQTPSHNRLMPERWRRVDQESIHT